MPVWAAPSEQAQQIHDYWFGPVEDWLQVIHNNSQRWFEKGQELDVEIRNRFASDLNSARAGELDGWQDSSIGIMALVLLLDQFPRHVFRGHAAAFACDGQALEICLRGIEQGIDVTLSPVQQSFYYLPMEHAEDISMHDRCVEIMQQRSREASQAFQAYMANTLEYARQHRKIIQRFGRYPHRNEVLGRTSTQEELDYLADGAARFGQ